ncbi:MAG TPA: molybdopterin cofactor-binding domain-containing protein, partial [Candidatus Sulfotelmatobacter sp.]|nr:molybdopterin cofactor-binding domain-containing protein [Candidatus Sulfotelmatobacter sp.]
AAEELDVPVAHITMVAGDTALTPNESYTSGSQSIEHGGSALRYAAAEARAVLLDRAAAMLGLPAERLTVANGVVHGPHGKRLGYGQIAAAGLLHRPATARVAPKPAAAHRIVGRSVARLDIPKKVFAEAIYVQDMRLPGMVFGRVVRPPGPGARLDSVDIGPAERLPGVLKVLRDGSFLGLAAAREEQAIAAREALRKAAKWRAGAELPAAARIDAWLLAQPSEDAVVAERSAPAPPAVRQIEATFTKRHVAHAAIGPSCAVALMEDGKLKVWSHSQGVYPLRADLATALKLKPEAITVSHAQGSGCYGHNGADDAALDAALLARAMPGRPVKLQWMRDDEFAWEPYGSAMVMKLRAGLGADGRIVDWQHEVWSNTHSTRPGSPGGNNLLAAWYMAEPLAPAPPRGIPQPAGGADRNAVPLYDFPRLKVAKHLVKAMPIRVSSLRTLGAYANVFALESFMDELAAAAGADRVEFRLRHLGDPRAKAVIALAAEKAGWQAGGRSGDGRGRGIGFARYKNLACYVACIAEVAVERKTGTVDVRRVVAAADAGQIVNPDGLTLQIEGGVLQAISWTLKEAVGFDRARITSRDWSGYPILTFAELPRVEVHLIDRPEEKPLGSGEASLGPAAAALANAVADALGVRCRDLPLTPERIKGAVG